MGMTLLDHGQPADTTTTKHHTGLIAVLAVLAVALLAAGAWLIVDHQQQPSAEERGAAALALVSLHRDAVNAESADLMWTTITTDASYVEHWKEDERPVNVVAGQEYVDLKTGGWVPEKWIFTDAAVVSDDGLAVTVPGTIRFTRNGETGAYERGSLGTMVFTLQDVNGEPKIASIDYQNVVEFDTP
jgi:hypothetical protein